MIVAKKRTFSIPRFVRYTLPSPPNVDERPVPRFCNKIATIIKIADKSWRSDRIGFIMIFQFFQAITARYSCQQGCRLAEF